MDSLSQPMRVLHDDASWFARATEVKLLHVRCDAAMRTSALAIVESMEAHAANVSPFITLEDAWKRSDAGWKTRATRLTDRWEERRCVSAEEGLELGSLEDRRAVSSDPLGAFGAWLSLVLEALRPPLCGLVIVLAPTQIEDAAAFESELAELLRQRELSAVRWVVLEMSGASLDGVHERLGARAMKSECMHDQGAFARDLGTMMSAIDPLMSGPARAGAAWPRGVFPPSRPNELVPTEAQRVDIDIELVAAGVSPALAGEQGARLQQYVLAAALQMKVGNGELALEYQREACRIAHEAQGSRELLLLWMVLAGYEQALGYEDDAEKQYENVAASADADGHSLERAQAGLALALIAARRGHHPDAARHYAQAADAALRAEAVSLAIECWRLAGHMAAEAGLTEQAASCWRCAIELGESAEPSVAKSSNAALAARQLAERLRLRGQRAEADALEHQANRIEAGETRALAEAGA